MLVLAGALQSIAPKIIITTDKSINNIVTNLAEATTNGSSPSSIPILSKLIKTILDIEINKQAILFELIILLFIIFF